MAIHFTFACRSHYLFRDEQLKWKVSWRVPAFECRQLENALIEVGKVHDGEGIYWMRDGKEKKLL